jgi:transposase
MLRKYDEYLTSVINANQDQFQNLNELLTRHRTLQLSNEKLESDRLRIEKETEDLKQRINNFEKEKAN